MDMNNVINKLKGKVLQVTVVVIAVFLALKIYTVQNNALGRLQEVKTVAEKVNITLIEISTFEDQYKEIKSIINRKDVFLALDNLTELAKFSEVNILGIKPQAPKDFSEYTLYSFELSLSVKDFHHLGKFFEALEASEYIYFLNNVNIKCIYDIYDAATFEIKVDLRISTIAIKE